MRRWCLLISIVLGVVQSHGDGSANPMDVFGFGARGMAMGNAFTAVADDGSANYYNPAGLALADDLRIDIGYLRTFTNLRLNERDMEVDENNGLMASVNIPGDIGPIRLAFGLGLFLPDARISRVRALPQYQPRFVMLDNRTQRIFIAANLAIRPIPELTIGGGLSFVTHMSGGVAVDGTLFPEPERALLRTAVDVDFKTVRAPAAGVTVTPLPWLRLGLVYRGEVKVQLDVEAGVVGEIKELLGTKTLAGSFHVSSFNTNLFSPQQVFLGAAFWPAMGTTLSVDVGWLNWSAYPAPTAAIDIAFLLEDFDTEGLLPEPAKVEPPGFHDVVTVRFGAEHRVSLDEWADLACRAGYAYEPTPSPSQEGVTNFVDTDKHLFTAGLAFGFLKHPDGLERPIQLDVAGQYFYYPERVYTKSNPTDLIGDYRADGAVWSISATARFMFPW